MEVTKKLTPYNFTSKNDKNRIKYIVVHYFGGLSTAENLLEYWHRQYVGASAHYIVGMMGRYTSLWRMVTLPGTAGRRVMCIPNAGIAIA